jgi:hypothetical protein
MLFHVSLTISSRNTARHGWEDFAVDDDVWVFDPEEEETSGSSDADVEMSVNGDEDTSSGDEDGYDDASDDESMSSEDDSNEDDDGNTARHGWEDFAVDDDVWVFDPEEEETSGSSDADVEMLVNGDEDTSSGDEDGYDDASDDESMSSEDDSNEDDDASEDGYDILERLGSPSLLSFFSYLPRYQHQSVPATCSPLLLPCSPCPSPYQPLSVSVTCSPS